MFCHCSFFINNEGRIIITGGRGRRLISYSSVMGTSLTYILKEKQKREKSSIGDTDNRKKQGDRNYVVVVFNVQCSESN